MSGLVGWQLSQPAASSLAFYYIYYTLFLYMYINIFIHISNQFDPLTWPNNFLFKLKSNLLP